MTAKEYLSQAYRLDQRIDSNISEITLSLIHISPLSVDAHLDIMI